MHHVVEKCSLWQEWTWSSIAHLLGPRLHSGQPIAHPATGFSPSFRSAHCSPSRATGFCLHSGQLIAHPATVPSPSFSSADCSPSHWVSPSFRSAHCSPSHWVQDSKTLTLVVLWGGGALDMVWSSKFTVYSPPARCSRNCFVCRWTCGCQACGRRCGGPGWPTGSESSTSLSTSQTIWDGFHHIAYMPTLSA